MAFQKVHIFEDGQHQYSVASDLSKNGSISWRTAWIHGV